MIGVWRGGAPRDRGGTVGATGLLGGGGAGPRTGSSLPSKSVCHGAEGPPLLPVDRLVERLLQPIQLRPAASANAPDRVKVRFPMAPSPANFLEILIGEQCNNSASNARSVAPLSQLGRTPAWKWAITWFANAISACVHCPVRQRDVGRRDLRVGALARGHGAEPQT